MNEAIVRNRVKRLGSGGKMWIKKRHLCLFSRLAWELMGWKLCDVRAVQFITTQGRGAV